jgi:hypothetical protein
MPKQSQIDQVMGTNPDPNQELQSIDEGAWEARGMLITAVTLLALYRANGGGLPDETEMLHFGMTEKTERTNEHPLPDCIQFRSFWKGGLILIVVVTAEGCNYEFHGAAARVHPGERSILHPEMYDLIFTD